MRHKQRPLRVVVRLITLLFVLGAIVVLAAGCGGPSREKAVYWRGEMWDGMNRMVFALQDLGWHIDTVDTDEGRIVASRPREGAGRPDTEDDPEAAAGDFFSILVQFSEDPNTPIAIGPEDQGDEDYPTAKLLRMISKITKRFEWYGGKSVEVIG